MTSVTIPFTLFVFKGKPHEVEAYGAHLVSESRRFAARADFVSVLAINADLRIIEKWRFDTRLKSSLRSSQKHS